MLSIGKLSEVAQATKSSIESREVQEKIEGESSISLSPPATKLTKEAAVDDQLDVVQVQETLHDLFVKSLSGSDLQKPTSVQGELIATRVAPNVQIRPACAQVRYSALPTMLELTCPSQLFALLSAQLLEGRTLSPEELVDLLTLKENDGDQVSSFDSALEVLIRAKVRTTTNRETPITDAVEAVTIGNPRCST